MALLQHFQGYSGFFKSLDKEYEQTKCRTININLPGKPAPEKVAAITLDEILHPDGPAEVFYQNDSRQTLEPVPSPSYHRANTGPPPEQAIRDTGTGWRTRHHRRADDPLL